LAANQRGGEGEKFLFFFPLSKEPYLYLSSVRKRRKTIRKRRGK
jgi:chlorite dismutase